MTDLALNPPILGPIPAKLLNDPELQQYFQNTSVFMQQLYRLLERGEVDLGDVSQLYPEYRSRESDYGLNPGFSSTQKEQCSANDFYTKSVRRDDPFLFMPSQPRQDYTPESVARDKKPFFVSVSADYTARENICLVIVTAAVTISLDPAPKDGQQVKIKRVTTAGTVTIDSNGADIDGAATYSMLANYQGLDLIYSRDAGEWLLV